MPIVFIILHSQSTRCLKISRSVNRSYQRIKVRVDSVMLDLYTLLYIIKIAKPIQIIEEIVGESSTNAVL